MSSFVQCYANIANLGPELDSLHSLQDKIQENKKSLFAFFKKDHTDEFINQTTALVDRLQKECDFIPKETKFPFSIAGPLLNKLDHLTAVLETAKQERQIALVEKIKQVTKQIAAFGPYPIELPYARDREEGKIAFVVDNLLSEEECKEWIAEGERIGFKPALVNGQEDVYERKSDRCFIISAERALSVFNKLKPHLPPTMASRALIGVNDKITMLRYQKGDYFRPHLDGFIEKEDKRSYFTVMLYFKGNTEGGNTAFLEKFDENRANMKTVEVPPRTGRALIFEHKLLHESTTLVDGIKYAARVDVLYQKVEIK